MEGYCPVTVQTARKWLKGSPKVQIEHRGRVYHFVSEVERDQFRANPDRYSPVFNGLDPVLLIEQRQAVEGTRRFGYEYRGAVYLFSSKETMEKFGASTASADYYSGLVYEAMRRLDSSGETMRR
jgi:YHS domain-containing protein